MVTQIEFRKCSYEQFCSELAILDIGDKTGTFQVKQHLKPFLLRVCRNPNDLRLDLYEDYTKKLYEILVTNAVESFDYFIDKYISLNKPLEKYLYLPKKSSLEGKVFNGQKNAWLGRFSKNLNHQEFFSTKKYSDKDSEYTYGLLRVMYEKFHIRNSMACPAFFDSILKAQNYGAFWKAFMLGCNKPSIFNPHTYYSILSECFSGEVLFAPVMGWNSYQIGFQNSSFKHMITTDVIPSVVDNSRLVTRLYDQNPFIEAKQVDAFLSPSEKLGIGFIHEYQNMVDAVLFSPPYYNLEVYESGEQSYKNYPSYSEWLDCYWRVTLQTCAEVMKRKAKIGFVISNYRGNDSFCADMTEIANSIFVQKDVYSVKWAAQRGSRAPKKQAQGNLENLYIYSKI